jgi:hypothetical protein
MFNNTLSLAQQQYLLVMILREIGRTRRRLDPVGTEVKVREFRRVRTGTVFPNTIRLVQKLEIRIIM